MNAAGPASASFSTMCGSDYLALSQGGTTSYYASSDQGLVAVVQDGKCVAGPSDFVIPAASSCPLVTCGMQSCGGPPDGGIP